MLHPPSQTNNSNQAPVEPVPITKASTSTTVFINPKFKNAHINPNFLPKPPPLQSVATPNQIYINPKFKNAHINPMFLHKNSTITAAEAPAVISAAVAISHNDDLQPLPAQLSIAPLSELTSIVTKTSRKIIRQPAVSTNRSTSTAANVPKKPSTGLSSLNAIEFAPLLKLGQRKLIRATHVDRKLSTLLSNSNKSIKKPVHTTYKIVKGDALVNMYKIDRRLIRTKTPIKNVHRVGGINETLSTQKVIITDRKLLRMFVHFDVTQI